MGDTQGKRNRISSMLHIMFSLSALMVSLGLFPCRHGTISYPILTTRLSLLKGSNTSSLNDREHFRTSMRSLTSVWVLTTDRVVGSVDTIITTRIIIIKSKPRSVV